MNLAHYVEERTLKTTDCWYWIGNISPDTGYGRACLGGTSPAHRVAYELAHGSIPSGLVIDHLCRNRSCVNPRHLEPVTRRENTLRGIGIPARHARSTHCPKGHPWDEQNTVIQRGVRLCRTCRTARERAYYETIRPSDPWAVQRKDVCHRGHPRSGDNLYVSASGRRNCRACARISDHKRRAS